MYLRKYEFLVLAAVVAACVFAGAATGDGVPLPPSRRAGDVSVESSIAAAENAATFERRPLTLEQLGQLAWAGMSERSCDGTEKAEMMSIYFVLDTGVFVYQPGSRSISRVVSGDRRASLSSSVSGGRAIASAPCSVVFAAKPVRLSSYGERSGDVVIMHVGRSAAMMRLQAVAMGLGTASFDNVDRSGAARTLQFPGNQTPVHVLAVGAVPGGPATQPIVDEEAESDGTVLVVVPERGVSDEEYLSVTDALSDAGFAVRFATAEGEPIRTRGGIAVNVTLKAADADMGRYKGLVLLGGPEARQYFMSRDVHVLVREAALAGKPVGAISTAPRILANAGVLRERRATANPTERRAMTREGAIVTGADVETDGAIVTAIGSAGKRFADELVRLLRNTAGSGEDEDSR